MPLYKKNKLSRRSLWGVSTRKKYSKSCTRLHRKVNDNLQSYLSSEDAGFSLNIHAWEMRQGLQGEAITHRAENTLGHDLIDCWKGAEKGLQIINSDSYKQAWVGLSSPTCIQYDPPFLVKSSPVLSSSKKHALLWFKDYFDVIPHLIILRMQAKQQLMMVLSSLEIRWLCDASKPFTLISSYSISIHNLMDQKNIPAPRMCASIQASQLFLSVPTEGRWVSTADLDCSLLFDCFWCCQSLSEELDLGWEHRCRGYKCQYASKPTSVWYHVYRALGPACEHL